MTPLPTGLPTRMRTAALAAAVAILAAGCAVPAAVPAPSGSAEASASASATPTTSAPSPSATAELSPSASATGAAASPSPSALSDATGTAMAAVLALEVREAASSEGYSREQFGDGWVDVDRNGCSTRDDMLEERLENVETSGSCTVTAGDLPDPFTGEWIHFERGGASEVDIDHLVALSAAWTTGAQDLTYSERVSFANDPLNLEPVDAGENRSKGDDDASEWLPPEADFRCEYVARQVAVKTKYALWVTPAELDAMVGVLDTCPDQELPSPGDQPVISTGLGEAPAPATTAEPDDSPQLKKTSTPKSTPTETSEPDLDERYPYCKDLPSGYGPYVKGTDPEYEWYSDRDGDGVVCE
ncbi:DUF1524 domain-containing protein [Demequina sp. NBRC 110051]|uniref:GmrSD restriction endonuclease domain-containing protein n=1 Tax=Demequina sp. NBRC 110051 TaxID=1570340 RepID=UPI0009FE6A08|nr:DUF1524 domain-containing protein [Demequina sp. NBRC 110051]